MGSTVLLAGSIGALTVALGVSNDEAGDIGISCTSQAEPEITANLNFAQSEFGVKAYVSKPSSQGRLEGATRTYLCVFETYALTSNGLRST